MSNTPRTDACIQVDCVGDDHSPLIEHAKGLERELNAALVAAGVASMERGEWQAQRAGLYVLIREAVLTTIDRHEWDFSDDEDRVDFADMVIAFLPTAKEK